MLHVVKPPPPTRDPSADILQRVKTADQNVEVAVIADGDWMRICLVIRQSDGSFVRHDIVGQIENGEVAVQRALDMHASVMALQMAGSRIPPAPKVA